MYELYLAVRAFPVLLPTVLPPYLTSSFAHGHGLGFLCRSRPRNEMSQQSACVTSHSPYLHTLLDAIPDDVGLLGPGTFPQLDVMFGGKLLPGCVWYIRESVCARMCMY